MVIEYIGTIIRSEVANRKERLYESQVMSQTLASLSWKQLFVIPTLTFVVFCVLLACVEPRCVHVQD